MILLKNVISICLLCNTILEPKYEYDRNDRQEIF